MSRHCSCVCMLTPHQHRGVKKGANAGTHCSMQGRRSTVQKDVHLTSVPPPLPVHFNCELFVSLLRVSQSVSPRPVLSAGNEDDDGRCALEQTSIWWWRCSEGLPAPEFQHQQTPCPFPIENPEEKGKPRAWAVLCFELLGTPADPIDPH